MRKARKRARQAVEDISDSTPPSMIAFGMNGTLTQPQKFDMTDLFLATESSSSDAETMFDFPSLQWPGLDAHKEEDEGYCIGMARQDSSSALSKESNGRRSLSTSCLLGKRSRSGGLLRSKTMRSEVDRSVNNFANDPYQSGMMFSFGSTKA
jgi:hypothetical protein